MTTDTPRTLILGVGNLILGDEGFGVHVAHRLKQAALPASVTVSEGHVGGFDLLGVLEGISRVIVVDVMITDLAPGQIRLFKPGPECAEPGKRIISFHQVGVPELARLWGLLGYEPEVWFLVTRPQQLDWSTEMSAPVAAAADKAAELLLELCREDFAGLERSRSLCSP